MKWDVIMIVAGLGYFFIAVNFLVTHSAVLEAVITSI
jgi:hypothetical protein